MNLTESQSPPAKIAAPVPAQPAGYKQTWLWTRARDTRLGDLVRATRNCRRELWAWAQCRQTARPTVEQLAESIAALHGSTSETVSAEGQSEGPIFLLSTGWRAGSTLLQRILVTDQRLLLWGEPLGEMTFVSKIAEMMAASISPRNLRQWKNQEDPSSRTLATSWVANLYPESDDFRLALRSLFDQWLAEPALKRGFTRWGLKEVRIGATEAYLLHWLYPNAKFVLISRHPYDCYRSLADSDWQGVYYRYPDMVVDSAAAFALCWNQIAVSWDQLPEGFPCYQIKYGDLIGGKVDFRKLESWLGLEIKEDVALKASVGGTAKRSRISWYERLIIAREAKAGMNALGYAKTSQRR
jgi:hypothetical protein